MNNRNNKKNKNKIRNAWHEPKPFLFLFLILVTFELLVINCTEHLKFFNILGEPWNLSSNFLRYSPFQKKYSLQSQRHRYKWRLSLTYYNVLSLTKIRLRFLALQFQTSRAFCIPRILSLYLCSFYTNSPILFELRVVSLIPAFRRCRGCLITFYHNRKTCGIYET